MVCPATRPPGQSRASQSSCKPDHLWPPSRLVHPARQPACGTTNGSISTAQHQTTPCKLGTAPAPTQWANPAAAQCGYTGHHRLNKRPEPCANANTSSCHGAGTGPLTRRGPVLRPSAPSSNNRAAGATSTTSRKTSGSAKNSNCDPRTDNPAPCSGCRKIGDMATCAVSSGLLQHHSWSSVLTHSRAFGATSACCARLSNVGRLGSKLSHDINARAVPGFGGVHPHAQSAIACCTAEERMKSTKRSAQRLVASNRP